MKIFGLKIILISGAFIATITVKIIFEKLGNQSKNYVEEVKELRKVLRNPNPPDFKNLYIDKKYSQAKQDVTVYQILQQENGVFIEMGAFDGKTLSNTLWLERKHQWTGILIEANPYNCLKIDALKRNAWRLCACISGQQRNVSFVSAGSLGGIEKELTEQHFEAIRQYDILQVPCFKMSLVLNVIGVHHIDYFSLDIEGGEINFLNSIKKELLSGEMTVDLWTIEYRVWPSGHDNKAITLKILRNIRAFFEEIGGYFEHSKLTELQSLSDERALDVVFVRIDRWCSSHPSLPGGIKC